MAKRSSSKTVSLATPVAEIIAAAETNPAIQYSEGEAGFYTQTDNGPVWTCIEGGPQGTSLEVINVVIPEEPVVEAAVERSDLVYLALTGARVTPQSIIHPNLWGKERWFAKKRLHSFEEKTAEDGSKVIVMVIPRKELAYRDDALTEPQATILPFNGEDNLKEIGGSWSRLDWNHQELEASVAA